MSKEKKEITITKEQVEHIGTLANLKLTSKEILQFKKELTSTLNYIQKLQEVQTEAIEPTYQVTDLKNIFREDMVKPSLTQKEAIQNGMAIKNGFFMTKKVL